MYVDDVAGAFEYNETYCFYSFSKQRLLKGSFTLRKFVTNSHKLQSLIQKEQPSSCIPSQEKVMEPEDTSYAQSLLQMYPDTRVPGQKILGVLWDHISDTLIFDLAKVAELADTMEPTKRNTVSLAARFYDLLGIISPVTIRMKILFQMLCKRRVDWDQLLSEDLLKNWSEIILDLSKAEPISVEKCYFSIGEECLKTKVSLQGFCDASSSAYAAVIHL